MDICFFLKSDMKICCSPVFVFEVQEQPFNPIPQKERNIEKFTLLNRVNEFMIKLYRVQIT